MTRLYVAREPRRIAMSIPMEQSAAMPHLLIPFTKDVDPSKLDELIRQQLDKLGVTNESDVQKIVEKAETDFEARVKIEEARKEIRRLMDMKRNGAKLMSVGRRKWRQAFYPASKNK